MVLDELDRLPTDARGRTTRLLWSATAGSMAIGLVAWLIGLSVESFVPGVIAMWCFAVAAMTLGWVLPLPYAIVSPLFMGIVGWLVDMLPFVMLVGWFAVVVRWLFGMLRQRRLPGTGRWTWLPIALAFWTMLGAAVVLPSDRKHFVLLFGLQVLISGAILIVAESFERLEARRRTASGLLVFVIVCTIAVFLQWIGLPIEALQDEKVSAPVERAYGINAFVNSTGMIKYERAADGGAKELRRTLERYRKDNPEVPDFETYRASFKAFGTDLVVRFEGSARHVEDELQRFDIELIYDNVGLAPGNQIPRMRSFPRNALTYAGVCAAALPFAFFVIWTERGRRRWIGWAALVGCLFGAAFSLARGAWAAIAVGVIYLFIDLPVSRWRKLQVVGAVVAAAIVLTVVFLIRFEADPLTARAGAEGSVATRQTLYEETVGEVKGIHILLGYGSERPRDEEGNVPAGLHYVPEAGSHSTYLNYLFRAGVPGTLMLMALYVVAWLFARRSSHLRQLRGPTDRLFSAMAAMAVVTFAAHGVVLSLYVEPVYALTVSIVLGLAIAGVTGIEGRLLPFEIPKPWKRSTARPS
ncbi:MAG: O-antigen ligase family protein [Actinomycetota bacterium]